MAVAVALPVATMTIQPWQALAGPEPAAATTSAVPTSGPPLSRGNGHTSALAVDPERDPDRRGQDRERGRKQQAAPDDKGRGKAPNPNCTLIVPAAPLTAQGLATPYQLVATNRRNGACREANADQSAFVEATIIDPATGALSIYRPLVIDRGTKPAAPPVVPKLPPGAVVGLWFGFQGDVLTLRGAADDCVNGLPRSPFGQFAYCGAPDFFDAANAAIGAGKLKVPPVGKARDGKPCPTTRDFSVVDQDQSDNLNTSYLALANGRTAQDNAANAKSLPVTKVLKNDSDNFLLNGFIGPALGCQPFTAPDLTAGGTLTSSLALNELQAAAAQAQPVALIPPNNPMAQVDGKRSVRKANLYRAGVNMPPLDPAVDTAKNYCRNLATIGLARLRNDRQFTVRAPSPDPAAANNLFIFLQQRLKGSLVDLGCAQARRER
ncbi:MAG TPA: hypothetical protein VK887_13005 [Pseudonocardiaceae bacterium]|nr:hypothetical protein [Pseudonocardiaceae bacterium]